MRIISMPASRWYVTLALLVASAAPGAAQQPVAVLPCTENGYNQFDFWVGTWIVTLPNGRTAGTNRITKEMGGCVLHERWSGAGGVIGESFSTYVPASRSWHQTWVDNSGTLILLDGEAVGDTIRLRSADSDPTGVETRQEVQWYPLDARRDTVRQLWRISRDGGNTWIVVFDGRYARQRIY